MLKSVGLANFTQEVIRNDGPVLVDFHSVQCGPCRQLKPALEAVAGRVKVVTVDIEDEPELAQHYGIENVPTVIQFKDGKPAHRVVGVQRAESLLELAAA